MLAEFKPVAFDVRGRRTRRRLPPWLTWLLVGGVGGAAAVVYVQERHLPPRLSYEASGQLQQRAEQAEGERQRMASDLTETQRRLQAALAAQKALDSQLADSRRSADALRADVAALVEALPPDPRGATVVVRSGRFRHEGARLAYDVLLTHERTGAGRPLAGRMQVVLSGSAARGGATTVALPPVPVSLQTHQSLSGEAPLPGGFSPQQATVRITDASGALLGSRVLYVR